MLTSWGLIAILLVLPYNNGWKYINKRYLIMTPSQRADRAEWQLTESPSSHYIPVFRLSASAQITTYSFIFHVIIKWSRLDLPIFIIQFEISWRLEHLFLRLSLFHDQSLTREWFSLYSTAVSVRHICFQFNSLLGSLQQWMSHRRDCLRARAAPRPASAAPHSRRDKYLHAFTCE